MGLSLPHLLLVILIILLLFGAKKVPEIMKDLARGYQSFRRGLEEDERDVANNVRQKNIQRLAPPPHIKKNRKKKNTKKA